MGLATVRKQFPDSNVLSGAQTGWVVRVGVFSEPNNLKKRKNLLLNNGMTSRQEIDEINGRPMVRIFFGPFADLATAERESGKGNVGNRRASLCYRA